MADDAAGLINNTAGHRQRLKSRLMSSDCASMADYELLELALFYALPRRDVKPLAKQLLRRFGSLTALVHASPVALAAEINGDAVPHLLRLLSVLLQRLAHGQLKTAGPLLADAHILRTYLQTVMSPLLHEEFHIFWLDSKGCLLHDDMHQRGTLDRATVYPRELVVRGVALGAAGAILAHNHPSGDPSPSRSDIKLTHSIAAALKAIDITVYDHMVVGHGKIISFRELGLLG